MSDWEFKPLGEICDIARGGSPRPIQAFLTDADDGVNWVKISDATASGKYIYSTIQKIKPEGASRSRVVNDGDFLLSNSMSFGRPYIMRTKGCVHDGWLVLSNYEKYFNQDFLYHLLGSPQIFEQFDRLAAGSTVRNLNIDLASRVVVPIPSLKEQRCIVAILDEAFEGIATAKANVEKNLKNARELFEAALDAALSSHEKGCVETRLGNETDLLAGYAFSSKSYTDAANGVRLLRGDNIMQGYLRWDDAKHWPVDDLVPHARFALQQGDVVLAMDRPWVKAGLKRAQIGEDDLPCLQLQRTARLRPKQRIRLDFLFHLVGSRSFSQHLLGVQTGLGVPHISGKQIESFQFTLPSMIKQAAIASALNDLQQQTERLEGIYDQKISALDELKKSLLNQAFTGQL
jgi:type I restriction enzyme, S subunit